MNELHQQVARAHRRLELQRFLGLLGWCCFAALGVALVLAVVDRFYPLGVPGWSWAVGGLGIGLLAAIIILFATRPSRLGAAIEIDRRFGLKERVSSTLALSPEEHETEIGRALVADAQRRIGRIDVRAQFAVVPRKRILLPLLPGLLALAVALIPPLGDEPADAKPTDTTDTKPVVKAIKPLQNQLAQRRKEAEESGLKDAEQLFKKLEEGTRDLVDPKTDRTKALARLNDLNRELATRRNQLGSDQVRKELDRLKDLGPGPAKKFAKAVQQGDFQKAADELAEIQKQLESSDLDEAEKQQLAQQLEKMQEQLKGLAEEANQAKQSLEKAMADAQRAGDTQQASELAEQLSQLMDQMPQMQQLNDLANKLGQCSQCLRNGEAGQAAEALQQLQDNLQQQLQEMQMLDEAMEQLCQARDQMNCKKCNGAGCPACQGMGQGQGGQGEGGDGMGAARGGRGPRAEAEDDTDTYWSQVRQKIGQGSAVVTGLVEGPNIKGTVGEAIRQEEEAAEREATDPMADRNIPRNYKNHVTEYFDRFREGE